LNHLGVANSRKKRFISHFFGAFGEQDSVHGYCFEWALDLSAKISVISQISGKVFCICYS